MCKTLVCRMHVFLVKVLVLLSLIVMLLVVKVVKVVLRLSLLGNLCVVVNVISTYIVV